MSQEQLLKLIDSPKLKIKGIKNIELFAYGKRGLIYKGNMGKKKVAIKIRRKESKAEGNIRNEAEKLKILNKYNIGPKLIKFERGKMIYQYVEGVFIEEFSLKAGKKEILDMIKKVFMQCYKMDRLKLNKEEMHHPVKHIVMSKGKPVMLDFERCHTSENPKNVTQFCQYMISSNMSKIMREKGTKIDNKKIIGLAREYKRGMTKGNLDRIIRQIR